MGGPGSRGAGAALSDYRWADAWARGPERVYRPLSAAIVEASPVPCAGRVVLDVGAGAGATSVAVLAAGGIVLAVDLSSDMLLHRRASRPPAVAGDALALPVRDRAVGGVVSAFCLTHLPDPARAIAEMGRVTVPGGPVVIGSFAPGPQHPVKAAVEQAVAAYGWTPPPWYRRMKEETEPLIQDEGFLRESADRAGLVDVRVFDVDVDTGVTNVDALAGWRLGLPHYSAFISELAPATRDALVADVTSAVTASAEPLRVRLRIFTAVAPGHPAIQALHRSESLGIGRRVDTNDIG